jgi:hypothetical protein
MLFPSEPFVSNSAHPVYDTQPEGERFVMILRGTVTSSPDLFVRNWSAAVARQLGN